MNDEGEGEQRVRSAPPRGHPAARGSGNLKGGQGERDSIPE